MKLIVCKQNLATSSSIFLFIYMDSTYIVYMTMMTMMTCVRTHYVFEDL